MCSVDWVDMDTLCQEVKLYCSMPLKETNAYQYKEKRTSKWHQIEWNHIAIWNHIATEAIYYFHTKETYKGIIFCCNLLLLAVFAARCCAQARLLPARGVCSSVRLSVTFVSCAKTNKDVLEFVSPSGSKAILVFRTKRDGPNPTGIPLTGASNARGYEKMTIFDQYLALSEKR